MSRPLSWMKVLMRPFIWSNHKDSLKKARRRKCASCKSPFMDLAGIKVTEHQVWPVGQILWIYPMPRWALCVQETQWKRGGVSHTLCGWYPPHWKRCRNIIISYSMVFYPVRYEEFGRSQSHSWNQAYARLPEKNVRLIPSFLYRLDSCQIHYAGFQEKICSFQSWNISIKWSTS